MEPSAYPKMLEKFSKETMTTTPVDSKPSGRCLLSLATRGTRKKSEVSLEIRKNTNLLAIYTENE